jgi:hypothetical protein
MYRTWEETKLPDFEDRMKSRLTEKIDNPELLQQMMQEIQMMKEKVDRVKEPEGDLESGSMGRKQKRVTKTQPIKRKQMPNAFERASSGFTKNLPQHLGVRTLSHPPTKSNIVLFGVKRYDPVHASYIYGNFDQACMTFSRRSQRFKPIMYCDAAPAGYSIIYQNSGEELHGIEPICLLMK